VFGAVAVVILVGQPLGEFDLVTSLVEKPSDHVLVVRPLGVVEIQILVAVVANIVARRPEEQVAGDPAQTEGVDLLAQRLHDADHVGRFGATDEHCHLAVELAVGDGGVGLVLGFHYATREGWQGEREANQRGVFPVGRRVGVVDVGVKLRCERLDELGVGLDLGSFLGQLVVAHPGVFEE